MAENNEKSKKKAYNDVSRENPQKKETTCLKKLVEEAIAGLLDGTIRPRRKTPEELAAENIEGKTIDI